MKFKVTLCYKEEYDGELANIAITNRAGRRWVSKKATESYYASEEADMLHDALNAGEKLDPNDWIEVAA